MSFRIWRQLLSSDPLRFHRRRYDVDVYRYGHFVALKAFKASSLRHLCVVLCDCGNFEHQTNNFVFCLCRPNPSLSLRVLVLQCSGVLKEKRSKVGQIVIVDVDSSDRGWPQPHSALLLLDTLNRFSS